MQLLIWGEKWYIAVGWVGECGITHRMQWPGVGAEDLLEKDEIDELEEIEWCLKSCSYDVYVQNFFLQGDFGLLKDDNQPLLVRLCFFFFFGDLEELCEGADTLLFAKGYLSKTATLGVESFSCYYCLPLFGKNKRDEF